METDIKQEDYFGTKPEQERMRNVASSVNNVVNSKEEVVEETTDSDEKEEVVVNPLIDAVSKAIKHTKRQGLFMQGVTPEKTPKKS